MPKGDDRFTERFHDKERKEKDYKKQLPTDDEPPLPPPVEPIHKDAKPPGRNGPCPCGSGKKYKQCCMAKDAKKKG